MLRAYIKDLKVGDVVLNQQFGVLSFAKKLGRTGNEYYEVILSDKSGHIDAKIWANSFNYCDLNINEGGVVEITGKVDSFNDKPQLIIEKLTEVKTFDPADFLYSGTRNKEEIWNYLINEVNSLEDAEIKNITLKILNNDEIQNSYKKATAAEYVHHDFVGGLLEHVYEMLVIAKSVKFLYPEINYSELVFGIVFHDIGKLYEYKTSGISLGRTKSGYLLGHIVQGLLFLNTFFEESFNADKKDRLLHLISSHHGSKEFGSPVNPSTIEAVMLSQIDDLSSKAGIFYTQKRNSLVDNLGFIGFNKYLGANILDTDSY